VNIALGGEPSEEELPDASHGVGSRRLDLALKELADALADLVLLRRRQRVEQGQA
jgi:hypothetical protein